MSEFWSSITRRSLVARENGAIGSGGYRLYAVTATEMLAGRETEVD